VQVFRPAVSGAVVVQAFRPAGTADMMVRTTSW
jgi:hypothetical protein